MKNSNKRIALAMLIALVVAVAGAFCNADNTKIMSNNEANKAEKILFINGSPNRNGNTAALAAALLEGKEYETLALTDYRINFYGQTLDGDQFEEVYDKMKEADVVVVGSPLYWHNVCVTI